METVNDQDNFEDQENYEDWLLERLKQLPAWFAGRMMEDVWTFGVMLSNGVTLVCSTLNQIHQAADGSLWLDFEMATHKAYCDTIKNQISSPTERTSVSVNANHIVAVFELADT
jgi:hypothetical protein